MTERKPPGMTFETWIDHQITQAQERGAFEGLEGVGRPLPQRVREQTSYEWALEWARRRHGAITALPTTRPGADGVADFQGVRWHGDVIPVNGKPTIDPDDVPNLDRVERLPDASLRFVYLLHPDPWPKARHAKRRMMNDGPVQMFADKLKSGGEFRFGTDHAVYLRHALSVMRRFTHLFDWQVKGPESWQVRPSGWPETRYEHKARTVYGHEVWYFRYRRT